MKKLEFKDLSEYDLGLVKSQAVNTFVATKANDGPNTLIESVFNMIHAMGYDIIEDGSREPTWSKKPIVTESKDMSKNWWKK